MPTGYTSYIQDGKVDNAKDFIMLCAKAFGACVDMRDQPLDALILEFKPSDYHLKELEKAQQRLVEINNITDEEIQKIIDSEYEMETKHRQEAINEKVCLRNKYMKVYKEIERWEIPTREHGKLKEFALSQIDESIKWDCDTSYYEEVVPKMTVSEYRQFKTKKSLDDIQYHAKNYKEEVEATRQKNKWIKDLQDSLNNL